MVWHPLWRSITYFDEPAFTWEFSSILSHCTMSLRNILSKCRCMSVGRCQREDFLLYIALNFADLTSLSVKNWAELLCLVHFFYETVFIQPNTIPNSTHFANFRPIRRSKEVFFTSFGVDVASLHTLVNIHEMLPFRKDFIPW